MWGRVKRRGAWDDFLEKSPQASAGELAGNICMNCQLILHFRCCVCQQAFGYSTRLCAYLARRLPRFFGVFFKR